MSNFTAFAMPSTGPGNRDPINLAADCDQKVDGITKTDLAHLRGLYKMGADKSLLFQQNDIADEMAKDAQER